MAAITLRAKGIDDVGYLGIGFGGLTMESARVRHALFLWGKMDALPPPPGAVAPTMSSWELPSVPRGALSSKAVLPYLSGFYIFRFFRVLEQPETEQPRFFRRFSFPAKLTNSILVF